ncbi:O protein, partial [Escherichia coli 10.0833]
IYGVDL